MTTSKYEKKTCVLVATNRQVTGDCLATALQLPCNCLANNLQRIGTSLPRDKQTSGKPNDISPSTQGKCWQLVIVREEAA